MTAALPPPHRQGVPAYYNEIDPHAAQWLRHLIDRGHIAPGDVDERSILDVNADDLKGYGQCHFFAGIGGWSYALRLAGIPDDRPVWTGSCPCQPFSAAGSQRGCADERHLWPAFFRLIRECRPATVVGEQVAGSAGLAWLDHVHADLEDAGYAVAAANLCAAGVGAPHVRQRLYWVAISHGGERRSGWQSASATRGPRVEPAGSSAACGVAYSAGRRFGQGSANPSRGAEGIRSEGAWERSAHNRGGIVGDTSSARHEGREQYRARDDERDRPDAHGPATESGSALDFWRDPEWIECSDGKARPTKPGIFPLAGGLPKGVVRGGDHGAPINADDTTEARVMRLRGYGNAIVPQVAAAFLMAATSPASLDPTP